jgi:hypothetical protein
MLRHVTVVSAARLCEELMAALRGEVDHGSGVCRDDTEGFHTGSSGGPLGSSDSGDEVVTVTSNLGDSGSVDEAAAGDACGEGPACRAVTPEAFILLGIAHLMSLEDFPHDIACGSEEEVAWLPAPPFPLCGTSWGAVCEEQKAEQETEAKAAEEEITATEDLDRESVASGDDEQLENVDLSGEGYTCEEWQAWHELRLSRVAAAGVGDSFGASAGEFPCENQFATEDLDESVASWEEEQLEIVGLYGQGYTSEEWEAWEELRLCSRHGSKCGGRLADAATEVATAVATAAKLEEAAESDQAGAKWLSMCTTARALPSGVQALLVEQMRELLPPAVWLQIELTARAMDDEEAAAAASSG